MSCILPNNEFRRDTEHDQGKNESSLKWKEDCILFSFILKSFFFFEMDCGKIQENLLKAVFDYGSEITVIT